MEESKEEEHAPLIQKLFNPLSLIVADSQRSIIATNDNGEFILYIA